MQEHEYIYEHEPEPSRHPLSEAEAVNDLGDQPIEQLEASFNAEIADQASNEIAELLVDARHRQAMRRLGRWLVVGFILSLLASIAALWLSGTLLSAPDQLLPLLFLKILATNRMLVLCIPVICLVVCYLALRSLTAEIMVVPERYLDERQKMVRDQAHRSAFKVIKFASVLIPVAFILPHLPWFNTPAPGPTAPAVPMGRGFTHFVAQGNGAITLIFRGPRPEQWHRMGQTAFSNKFGMFAAVHPAPLVPPASTLEIAVAGGLLLLALVLAVSALPMAVLVWKGNA